MKKLLFIISSDLFVRNYIQTGVIEALNKNFNCNIIAYKKIFNKDEVEKLNNFKGYYSSDPIEDNKRYNLMNIVLWRKKKKSSTFQFRIMRMFGLTDLNFFSSIKKIKKFLSFAKKNLKRSSLPLQMIIFGNLFIFPFFLYYFKLKLKLNKTLEKYIEILKPDLILFPSSAFDPIGYDILEISNKKRITTLFLIDNWDNLSSKTVFLRKPDFITVWGKQSLEHGVKIQGFKEKHIIMIGTPRFDIYYENLNNLPKSPINGKYVVFAGAALAMDETSALKDLDEELEQNKDIYRNLKIIYRPHPWRQGINDFNESNFKHVKLDMQMKDHYYSGKELSAAVDFQPRIDYYPAILGNALFIVAPLTTMALEALIMEKKVLLIVYDDGQHFTTPKNVFKYYEHFRGIEKLKGLTFCKEKSMLKQQFRDTYENMSRNDFSPIKSDLNYFLFNDNRTYQQRLFDTIKFALKSN